MVSNATFYNMSVISWRSVVMVMETGGPRKTTDLCKLQIQYAMPEMRDVH
jgi:hypothetical protein